MDTSLSQVSVEHQDHPAAQQPVDYVFQLTHDALYEVQSTEASAEMLTRTGTALQPQLLTLRDRMAALERASGHNPPQVPFAHSIEQLFGPYGKTHPGPRPMLNRPEAQDRDLHFMHDAIIQAGAASAVAAKAARHVQFLQGQVTALACRINDVAARVGPQHFEWLQPTSMHREP